jgi:DNA-binding MarR family transcriptional regulator
MADIVSLSVAWVTAAGGADMTYRQVAVLGAVCDAPAPPQFRALAKQLNMAKPVLTRALTKLGSLGLVARRRGEADGRDILVDATEQGRELRATMRELQV